jgi:multimeric flavodoxin WrbA
LAAQAFACKRAIRETPTMTEPTRIPVVRKGQTSWPISRGDFLQRFRARFADPRNDPHSAQVDELAEIAWRNYCDARKSPQTRQAGSEFAGPDYELSVDWLHARDAVREAAGRHADMRSTARVLLICSAARNDKSCPGEMSKTYRLTEIAHQTLARDGCDVDLLDLSVLTSEPDKTIYPCKACVSTSMPLCHWPCSCYPNHALGQVNDWMHEIYPRWVAAHGVLIITPVYWYQAPAGLKSMMDRLVCADGGNPDPTTTQGKDPERAKELELRGWDYPRHLAGRAFGVIVHGDAAGADILRRSIVDWLTDMKLVQAGNAAVLDRYIGYYEPYATSHEALDRDSDVQEEVRNVAASLARQIVLTRAGRSSQPDGALTEPRPK